MRTAVLAWMVFGALAFPEIGTAQVFRTESLPPTVTAAGESWQLNGEPVFHAGAFYYPSGPDRFFDGKVMVRTGVYEGVPLYADATLQPYSVVFVPIGGAVMRPYTRGDRVADRELERSVVGVEPSADADRWDPGVRDDAYVLVPMSRWRRIGRARLASNVHERFEPHGVVSLGALAAPSGSPRPPTVAPPGGTSGVWIQWQNATWFNSGAAVDYDPSRFEPVGDYRGFPVYRERGASGDRIYVTIVRDGPLAPFERH